MKAYQEITLLPNVEIGIYFLWEKVFQQVHLALAEMQDHAGQIPVGIAFPEYSTDPYQLGNKLRLFAPDEALLKKMDIQRWLSRLVDYVDITGIRAVPAGVNQYAIYKRQQPKSNVERLARRKAKRENIALEQAMAALNSYTEDTVKTPFIQFKSLSSQKRFRLFILKEVVQEPTEAGFTSYGLSHANSTVPEFAY
jgi:CRISPR-associated endonuclease Csy4